MTRACPLACKHCRARAQCTPMPGELTEKEGEKFVADIAGFGSPSPIVVMTGGDPLARADLFDRLAQAKAQGTRVALAPAVSPALLKNVDRLKERGVRAISISLDGATAETHEGIRQVPDHFSQTIRTLKELVAAGFMAQVNTTVMRKNAEELGELAVLLHELGVHAWKDPDNFAHGLLYDRLAATLKSKLGAPTEKPKATSAGNGILFVAHGGGICPAGFLPLPLGNVRQDDVVEVYRKHPVLLDIRAARFHGRCGTCEFSAMCGGSRSRAYASTGDALASDPACAYQP